MENWDRTQQGPTRAAAAAGALRYKEVAQQVGQVFRESKLIHKTPGSTNGLGSTRRASVPWGSSTSSTLSSQLPRRASMAAGFEENAQAASKRSKSGPSRSDISSGPALTKEDRMRQQLDFLEGEKFAHEEQLRDLHQNLSECLLQERRARILVDKHQAKVAAHEKKTQVVQMQINSIRKDLHGCEEKLADERRRSPSSKQRFSAPDSAMSMDVPASSSSSRLGSRGPQHQSSPELGASGRSVLRGSSRGFSTDFLSDESLPGSPGASLQFTSTAGSHMMHSTGFRTSSADSQRSTMSQPSLSSTFTGLQGALAGRKRATMAAQLHENEQTLALKEDDESPLDAETLERWFAAVEEDRRARHGRPAGIDQEEEANVVLTIRSIQDRHRDIIRSNLVAAAGSEMKAFKIMDFNGSGKICLGDFAGGVDRLGVPWKSIMGTTRPKELFKLFDEKHKGRLTFKDLFPGVNPYYEKDTDGASTPELYKRWCKKMDADPTSMNRKAKWVPKDRDTQKDILFKAQDKLHEVAAAKKRMEAMIKRLKTRGKSNARCREIAATHLPAGTGPEDMQGVKTFSQAQVDDLKREYIDKVFETSRDVQKVMFNMREQQKDLRKSRQALYAVTEEPYQRLLLAEEQKAQASSLASGFGNLLGKVKDPAPDTPVNATQSPTLPSLAGLLGKVES